MLAVLLLAGIQKGVDARDLSGTLNTDIVLVTNDAPHRVTGDLTISPGRTLSLGPGVRLEITGEFDIDVLDGGRIMAEGTAANPVEFTAAGASRWNRIKIFGSIGSPENRFQYVRIQGNSSRAIHADGGTIFLDHVTFLAADQQCVSLDNSSFVLSHCYFPSPTTSLEPVHGTQGIKPGGHGIIRRCFFGSTTGYSDVVDFTGGNRPSDPIIQFYNNVFIGSADDILDLDGTDAWVENNIFIHVHKNGSPDTAAAVSGGNTGGDTSEITMLNNIVFDCDQGATAKQGNFMVLAHNTIVRITKEGGVDSESAVLCLRELIPAPPTTFGKGAYLDQNIIWAADELVRNYDSTETLVTYVNNILPSPWTGPGAENLIADPKFVHLPSVSEATFASWEAAQVIRDWLAPDTNSPAIGRGTQETGVRIAGPEGITASTTAMLHITGNYPKNLIGSTAWPDGAGYTHFKWRLDGGEWSDEFPINTPILLTNLAPGSHRVEAVGKNDAGLYQNDPLLAEDAVVSVSKSWFVEAGLLLRIVSRTDGFELHFTPEAGAAYALEYSTSLPSASWNVLQTIPAASNPTEISIMMARPSPDAAFFRLEKLATPAF